MKTCLRLAVLTLCLAACEDPTHACIGTDCGVATTDQTAIIVDGRIVGYKGP